MKLPRPSKSSQPCHYSGVDTKSNSEYRTSNRNGDHKSIRSPIITRNSIRGGSSHSNSRVNSLYWLSCNSKKQSLRELQS